MSSPSAAAAREVRNTAPVFAALGDATRLRIVGRLATGEPLSIATLTAGTGVTRQAVTKHLGVLDEAGLVRSEWRGRERLWALNAERLDAARRSLDRIAAHWDAALLRLKSFVEAPRAD
jgi:DNA-binding transcriptional ArsR family regulator